MTNLTATNEDPIGSGPAPCASRRCAPATRLALRSLLLAAVPPALVLLALASDQRIGDPAAFVGAGLTIVANVLGAGLGLAAVVRARGPGQRVAGLAATFANALPWLLLLLVARDLSCA